MLFPAVYELGYQVGQTMYRFGHHPTPLPSLKEIVDLLWSFPLLYKEWWWNLVTHDPLHVLVETTLLVSIIYMMVSRSTEGYKKDSSERLTQAEQEELLREWKDHGRSPLVPVESCEDSIVGKAVPSIIVHKQHGRFMEITQEHDDYDDDDDEDDLASKKTKRPFQVLNFATFDFLGMQASASNSAIKEVSKQALEKYGCGSCGPRGFYGTIDIHLQLEDEISKFTHTDGAIMYSDGASTCSSTVAAFAKRGDLLVVDEGVYEPLVTGVMLSRANVKWFKHNDMEDLERVLTEVQKTDQTLGRKPNAQRRFIVVEGLYKNLGTICPLDKIVALKHKYHYRLILDDSFSFGTLGPHGKGVLDLYGLRHMYDAEIVTIGLENALGSIGGVTVGNEEVVDHQRLSGAGYCFSASAPPFVAAAAIQAIQLIGNKPELLQRLQTNIQYMHEQLNQRLTSTTLVVTSDERSPIIVLQLDQERPEEADILRDVAQECLQRGVAFVATGHEAASGQLKTELAPALRMTISSLHTIEDMDKAVTALVEAAAIVTSRYPTNLVN